MNVLNCNYEALIPNIVSSDNCYLFDAEGKRYADFESGVWCASIGHNNKQVNDAIITQMSIVSHTGYRIHNKIVDEAAESLSLTKLRPESGERANGLDLSITICSPI